MDYVCLDDDIIIMSCLHFAVVTVWHFHITIKQFTNGRYFETLYAGTLQTVDLT